MVSPPKKRKRKEIIRRRPANVAVALPEILQQERKMERVRGVIEREQARQRVGWRRRGRRGGMTERGASELRMQIGRPVGMARSAAHNAPG